LELKHGRPSYIKQGYEPPKALERAKQVDVCQEWLLS